MWLNSSGGALLMIFKYGIKKYDLRHFGAEKNELAMLLAFGVD